MIIGTQTVSGSSLAEMKKRFGEMYDRKDDDEKLKLYLKVEPKLRIFS